MDLDTKTLWMALVVSNLLFGLLMPAYAYPGTERPVSRTWALGQILKGLGIAVIMARAKLPPEIAFAGNSIVLPGYFLELSAFLLPGTPAEAALHVAERLRHAVADMTVEVDGRRIPVTASFGIADPGPWESLEPALSRADARLCVAKTEGRNRVAPALDSTPRQTAEVVKLVA